jgi:acyl-CoA thioester hydrolase
MKKNTQQFSITFEVRDYECDLQGIVNNSVYQNYLEHCRHKFINTINLDFADLHKRGIDLVVRSVNLTYKHALKSGDKFICTLNMEKTDPYKIIFKQNIYRLPDKKLMLKGEVAAVTVKDDRLAKSEIIFS